MLALARWIGSWQKSQEKMKGNARMLCCAPPAETRWWIQAVAQLVDCGLDARLFILICYSGGDYATWARVLMWIAFSTSCASVTINTLVTDKELPWGMGVLLAVPPLGMLYTIAWCIRFPFLLCSDGGPKAHSWMLPSKFSYDGIVLFSFVFEDVPGAAVSIYLMTRGEETATAILAIAFTAGKALWSCSHVLVEAWHSCVACTGRCCGQTATCTRNGCDEMTACWRHCAASTGKCCGHCLKNFGRNACGVGRGRQ
jgi:hypothetical protein